MILLIRLPVAEYCDWTFEGAPVKNKGELVEITTKTAHTQANKHFFATKHILKQLKNTYFAFFFEIICTFKKNVVPLHPLL